MGRLLKPSAILPETAPAGWSLRFRLWRFIEAPSPAAGERQAVMAWCLRPSHAREMLLKICCRRFVLRFAP